MLLIVVFCARGKKCLWITISIGPPSPEQIEVARDDKYDSLHLQTALTATRDKFNIGMGRLNGAEVPPWLLRKATVKTYKSETNLYSTTNFIKWTCLCTVFAALIEILGERFSNQYCSRSHC